MVCFGHILKILGLSHEPRFINAKLIIKIHLNKKCEKKEGYKQQKRHGEPTQSAVPILEQH